MHNLGNKQFFFLVNYVEEEAGGVFGHVMRKDIVERSAITRRLDGRQGRGRPRDMHIRTESQKMGGSNGEGRRHHHGDGGRRIRRRMVSNARTGQGT